MMTPKEAAGYVNGIDHSDEAQGILDNADVTRIESLLATIARMTWEYGVLCLVEGDVWRYARDGMLITALDYEATWLPTLEEAQEYAERRRRSAKATRIVRRLVSDAEVVE